MSEMEALKYFCEFHSNYFQFVFKVIMPEDEAEKKKKLVLDQYTQTRKVHLLSRWGKIFLFFVCFFQVLELSV